MRFTLVFFLYFLFSINQSKGQLKYWVSFTDKNVSDYNYKHNLCQKTLSNRVRFNLPLVQFTDIPVDIKNIKHLRQLGANPLHISKWLNAVSCFMNEEMVTKIRLLPFVKSVEPIEKKIILSSQHIDIENSIYSSALQQMQSNLFRENGITGEGVNIGVIDAGFFKANSDPFLEHLFSEFRILQQKDFIDPKRKDIITVQATDSDGHGKRVLDMITGYSKEDNIQIGMAVNAQFYLARTENGAREHRGEEDTWIEALEWMDSLGVRLISTSLGYAVNMDDPAENYKQDEMNGKTAKITKAAQIASDEKGIFLVVSAGNEGNNPKWRIISAPADAYGVLSVGATRENSWDKIGYSSVGPEFLPYLKPNVSCYSPDGTSFSAPAVAGFVACLMQKDSSLNNKQLKQIIEKSSHLYPYGNNYIGYGIPQASRALELLM